MGRDWKRSISIFQRVISGKTLNVVGEEYGISGPRARQIVATVRRELLGKSRWAGPDERVSDSLAEMRLHSKFWIGRAKLLRTEKC